MRGYSQHRVVPAVTRLWHAVAMWVYTYEDSAIINVIYSLIQKETFAWETADARQQDMLSLRR